MFLQSVDLDITDQCNLHCLHCNRPQNRQGPVLSTRRLIKLIDELYELGASQVLITGGEPTSRSDWMKIVAHGCNKPGLRVIVATNGTQWSESEIGYLSLLREPPQIAVSLDGFTPETYGIIRRKKNGDPASDLFQAVISTARTIVQAGLFLSVNVLVSDQTANHIEDTIKYASALGTGSILLLKYQNMGSHIHSVSINEKTWERVLDNVLEKKVSGQFGFDRTVVSVASLWELVMPLRKSGIDSELVQNILTGNVFGKRRLLERGIHCSAGQKYASIDAYGNVYPCAMACPGHRDLMAGNIVNRSFVSVWENSSLLQALRELSAEKLDAACGECSEIKWCGGGCRVRALYNCGSINAPDLACPLALLK